MGQLNVAQFASELGLPASLLLEQLRAAGVNKAESEDKLSEQDKTQLLEYLRRTHGAKEAKNKITVTRKQTTEIKKADSTGKARTIQVEVRKKRVLVKRDTAEETVTKPAVISEPKPAAVDEAQQAKRKDEARKQAELTARQTAEIQDKQKKASRKKGAEQPASPPLVEEEPAPEPVPPTVTAVASAEAKPAPSAGTLHKPTLKPDEKTAKAEKKNAKKQKAAWTEETHKKRAMRLRGDVGGAAWRERKGPRTKSTEDQAHAFAMPTEPVVHEVLVPETISVGALAL